MEILPTSSCPPDIQPIMTVSGSWGAPSNIFPATAGVNHVTVSGSLAYIPSTTGQNYNSGEFGPITVWNTSSYNINTSSGWWPNYTASKAYNQDIVRLMPFKSSGQDRFWLLRRNVPRETQVIDTTGSVDTTWNSAISASSAYFGISVSYWVGGVSNNYIYVATQSTGEIPQYIQRYNISAKSFDATFTNNNPLQGVTTIHHISGSSRVVIGGVFNDGLRILNESDRTYQLFTGSAGPNNLVKHCIQSGSHLYFCGRFSTWDGISCNGWAKTDLSGSLITGSITYPTASIGYVNRITLQSNGKILLGQDDENSGGGWDTGNRYLNFPGYNLSGSIAPGGLVRLNTDGTFDNTFTYPNLVTGYLSGSTTPEGACVKDIEVLANDSMIVTGRWLAVQDPLTYNETVNATKAIALDSDGRMILT